MIHILRKGRMRNSIWRLFVCDKSAFCRYSSRELLKNDRMTDGRLRLERAAMLSASIVSNSAVYARTCTKERQ